jgi:hypothetical protein
VYGSGGTAMKETDEFSYIDLAKQSLEDACNKDESSEQMFLLQCGMLESNIAIAEFLFEIMKEMKMKNGCYE